jgi:hypothetical protein
MYISTKFRKRMGKETWSREDFREELILKYNHYIMEEHTI